MSATGTTTTGLPIAMDETTYDDVYGRMGMFKIGAGYRITPRTEQCSTSSTRTVRRTG